MDFDTEINIPKAEDKFSHFALQLERQRDFFVAGNTRNINTRKKKLKALKKELKNNENQIAEALKKDFGKSPFESYASETGLAYEEISYFLRHLSDWTDREKVYTPLSNFKGTSYIYKVPLGNTLIISPWNYPLNLSIIPIIAAIAAGNTVFLKPSEYTPHINKVINQVLGEVFDEEEVWVVEGGPEVSKALLELPFDFIFFTGSTEIGKKIAQKAAERLIPCVLELGGKSPAIVDQDANLKVAARRLAWAKLFNAGQTCVSPDYLYLHENIKDEFLVYLKDSFKKFLGDVPQKSEDYARMINLTHFQRITSLLNEGEIIYGGHVDQDDLYIAPTVIDQIDWNHKIMQEEIFGPVFPILTFTNLYDTIALINQKPKPLAFYYFSNDKMKQENAILQTNFGGGCINDAMVHFANPHLSFGGIGNSGLGAYHGKAGFDAFSQNKSIMKKSTWIDVQLRYPPYKNHLRWLKKIIN